MTECVAMTVKKVGDDPGAIKRVTCQHCGSVLEYLPVDVRYNIYSAGDSSKTIKCPQCQLRVSVKSC